ncbi:hypothetical protein CRUP_016926 [Coryphaenoides rupestris]|nr:hypothetical protein CRUP_016926 [Coryphaenoides rupestris]
MPGYPEEMHAELCYAEVLLQKAALTFMDESIVGFIKGGMRIRNSYQIFKDCEVIANKMEEETKASSTYLHFRCGVNMGIGSFNLVLRLMEFLGFSGDRELGLSELRAGVATKGLRSIVSMLTLMMFHLYITVILGTGEVDLTESENLLEPYIKTFPNGALILFYTARIALLKGNFTLAREKYLACIAAQQEWRQIHHLCYWELMWAHSFEQDWKKAYHYAALLAKESKWSQATYVYQKAAILCMLPDEELKATGQNAEDLFKQVDGLRLRIAGKSEMMYVWNGFTIVGKRPELTYSILSTIKKLLKGLCLRQLGSLDEAERCFNHIIASEEKIKHDNYLVPFTTYELGLIYKQRGDTDKAISLLEQIKVNYKDYHMESRLHFRIHAALNTMGSFPSKPYPSRIQA